MEVNTRMEEVKILRREKIENFLKKEGDIDIDTFIITRKENIK